jgi:chromosome segregation protein
MAQRSEEAQSNKLEAEALTEANQKIEEELSAKRIELGRLVYEEQTLLEAQQKRSEERQHLLERVTQLGENLQAQNHNTQDLQKKREDLSTTVKTLNSSLKNVEQELNASSARVQENQVVVAKLQSEHKALIREVQSYQNQIDETKHSIESRESEMSAAAQEIEELNRANAANSKEQKDLEQKRAAIQQSCDKLKNQQYEINVKTDEQEKLIRTARMQNEEVSETVHQVELRVSELKLRMENLRSRILDEFEHTLKPEPISEEFDRDEATAQIEVLREKLKNIGPVNLLALKEWEQEKERFDFLKTQREDLIKARKNLTDTINIINATARDKFLETFEQIQKNFSIVFKTFFDGGRANLLLREGNDPLEADIDIFATPGGKRLSTLQLMSGGEKSLTAISLLFAIYLVKPSPFCIFDEVDAPLDDRNILRFTKALQEFATNTQFIIVTHNKLTMRAADQLYGITMEEDGVSKVVSVKFDREEAQDVTAQPVVSQE